MVSDVMQQNNLKSGTLFVGEIGAGWGPIKRCSKGFLY